MRFVSFEGYQLRDAVPDDLELACNWTEADEDHAGHVDPAFWLENGWLLLDADGPIFFFKGIRVQPRTLEIHVQFRPEIMRERLIAALIQGMAWLELNANEIDEICFESRHPRLIAFCEKRLGFKNSNGKLHKQLVRN
jgi:hypothetical protein